MIEINNYDPSLIEKRQEKLVKYLRRTLQILPCSILLLDNSKVLLAYFAVAGLDILDKLDRLPNSKPRRLAESPTNPKRGFCGRTKSR